MFTSTIETPKSSMTFKCFNAEGWCPQEIADDIAKSNSIFNLGNESPCFHDVQVRGSTLRGCFSSITPFEVKHLVNGKETNTLFKKITTCEFIVSEGRGIVFGDTKLFRLLASCFVYAIGKPVNFYSFELDEMNRLRSSMREVKSVALVNPSEREITQVKLSGKLGDYSGCNIIDYRNHDIESLSGVVEIEDELLGRVLANVAVKKNGSIRIGVKGSEMPYSCVLHVLKLLLGD